MRENAWGELKLFDGRTIKMNGIHTLNISGDADSGGEIEIGAAEMKPQKTKLENPDMKKIKEEIYKLDRFSNRALVLPHDFNRATMVSLDAVIKVLNREENREKDQEIKNTYQEREFRQRWEVLKGRADMIKDAIGDIEELEQGENE